MDPKVDSYSGFFDNVKREATGLGDYLKAEAIDEVYVVGLALDWCVKATSLDSEGLGFTTTLIEDASRAVTRKGGRDAVETMRKKGVHIVQSSELLQAD